MITANRCKNVLLRRHKDILLYETYYYDEMSVKEIASSLDISENTVKSRLNYARKQIKSGVENYEKHGIKLYGLSPIPFLMYFLHKSAKQSMLTSVQKSLILASATSGLSTGVDTETKIIATRNFLSSKIFKALGGAIVIAIVGCSIGFAINHRDIDIDNNISDDTYSSTDEQVTEESYISNSYNPTSQTCPSCLGTMRYACAICGGFGWIVCGTCGGSGVIYN